MNFSKIKFFLAGLAGFLILFLIVQVWSFYWGNQKFNNLALAAVGSTGNVSGFAWSSNFGWVSFNSKDCDANDDGFVDAVSPGCLPIGSVTAKYSVSIDNNGNFSGYAWSNNLGWIDFGPTSGFPAAPNSAGHYDSVTGLVSGWAQVLSLSADGWLNLGALSPSPGVTIDSSTNSFHGYAWNGNADTSTGLGWLSFNCETGDPNGNNICARSNYKVTATGLTPPVSVSNLTAPNWSAASACSASRANQAILRWTFNGTLQSAYQVIVNTVNNTTSPSIDTGKVASAANQYIASGLNYNTNYYWWVRVWDTNNATSSWVQYNSATDTDNDDGQPLTFLTYKHEFPDATFTFSPVSPIIGQTVYFVDHSFIYSSLSPATPITASTTNASWLWTFLGGSPASSTVANPQSGFNSLTSIISSSVIVTDHDGYACSTSTNIVMGTVNPVWREVQPK